MSGTALLIHGGESTGEKLRAALPEGWEVLVVYREGLSGAYDERTGLAREHPTLASLLAAEGSRWRPGEPLVVLGFSAGAWALRYYLRDARARQDVDAAVFLDGLYGAPGGVCNLGPYDGVLAFARLANAEPGRHRLVTTYSQATPAPGICSRAIEQAEPGPGVFSIGYAGGDHSAQQWRVGPEVVAELVTPWVRRSGGVSWATFFGVAGVAAGLWLLYKAIR